MFVRALIAAVVRAAFLPLGAGALTSVAHTSDDEHERHDGVETWCEVTRDGRARLDLARYRLTPSTARLFMRSIARHRAKAGRNTGARAR